MKSLAKKPEDSPLPEVAVTVPSLNPEYVIMYVQADGDYEEGDTRPVYGGNLEEDTVYTNGICHKDRRYAIEDGSAEIVLTNLPEHIEELRLSDYSKHGKPICKLMIVGAEVIPMPVRTAPKVPNKGGNCKVITHPATFTAHRIEKPASKRKPECKTLPLFPDYPPHKEIA